MNRQHMFSSTLAVFLLIGALAHATQKAWAVDFTSISSILTHVGNGVALGQQAPGPCPLICPCTGFPQGPTPEISRLNFLGAECLPEGVPIQVNDRLCFEASATDTDQSCLLCTGDTTEYNDPIKKWIWSVYRGDTLVAFKKTINPCPNVISSDNLEFIPEICGDYILRIQVVECNCPDPINRVSITSRSRELWRWEAVLNREIVHPRSPLKSPTYPPTINRR